MSHFPIYTILWKEFSFSFYHRSYFIIIIFGRIGLCLKWSRLMSVLCSLGRRDIQWVSSRNIINFSFKLPKYLFRFAIHSVNNLQQILDNTCIASDLCGVWSSCLLSVLCTHAKFWRIIKSIIASVSSAVNENNITCLFPRGLVRVCLCLTSNYSNPMNDALTPKTPVVCKGPWGHYIHAIPVTELLGQSLLFRSRKILVSSCYSPPESPYSFTLNFISLAAS